MEPVESVPGGDTGKNEPVQEMKPVKKNRLGVKIAALGLCCALLGGAVGGGVAWAAGGSSTSINVSSRSRHRGIPQDCGRQDGDE